MRLVKFFYKRRQRWGILEKERVRFLSVPPFVSIRPESKIVPLRNLKLCAPQAASKIVLVGLNYRDHAKELNMKIPEQPILFIKPASALIGSLDTIRYSRSLGRVDFEAELAVVIKTKAKDITPQQVKKHILGYTCLNDVTARDLQAKDIQWTRAKSFDTFCPLGPWIETDLETGALHIKTSVNGQVRQDSCTSNFIFNINYLVSFISTIMTLSPGDVISTGTPPGVGPLQHGDCVEVEIEGIGVLKNYVECLASPGISKDR